MQNNALRRSSPVQEAMQKKNATVLAPNTKIDIKYNTFNALIDFIS